MKNQTSFLKRCLAFVVAVMITVSGINPGALMHTHAHAAEGTTKTVAAIVADNYELSAAEEALLNSGYLAGGSYTYNAPTADLVTVDTDTKTITAATLANGEDTWTPTTAYIAVGEDVKETLDISSGTATYTYGENAFSVKVDYVLKTTIAADTQNMLLGAGSAISAGLDNLAAAYAVDSNLGSISQPDIMGALVKLADGISMSVGGGTATVGFGSAEAKNAIYALQAELTANGGVLKLSAANGAYAASASKTQYLFENGAAYKALVEVTAAQLKAMATDDLMTNTFMVSLLENLDPTTATLFKTVRNTIQSASAALDSVAATDWVVSSTLLVADPDYAALDALVAALPEQATAVTISETLTVADATVQLNMSMFNVTVKVTLNTVNNENVVAEYDKNSVVLTLAEGADPDAILAEVAASNIEADSITEWGTAYVEGKYTATKSVLPAALTEDIVYTITYDPNKYNVTYSYDSTLNTVLPYGTTVTLPVHADPAQSYDYTVNGKSEVQGAVITIVEDTVINRSSGKAYTATDLYSVIADNYGNDIAKAILKSGALKDNENISVRKPDPADAASLLTLEDGEIKADNYDASYNGLNWLPYSYSNKDGGDKAFFSGNTAPWSADEAKVIYKLTLTNYSAAKVGEIIAMAETLKAEATAQKSTLDKLAENYDAIGQVNKSMLGILIGLVDVTDFTPGDNTETDPKNLELRAYFKEVFNGIQNNNLDPNNQLKIYNMLGEYKNVATGGLRYYYGNSEALIAEINSLSGYLDKVVEEEEALRIMIEAAGSQYASYADKITGLGDTMAKIKADLTAPNAKIDLTSTKLGTLIDALTADGSVDTTATVDHPYLMSEQLTVKDSSKVMVQIIIKTLNGDATVTTETMPKGSALTPAIKEKLLADVKTEVDKLLNNNTKYYDLSVEGTKIEDLPATIDADINSYYHYTAKNYTVKIAGEEDQIINITDGLEISLPKHPTAGYSYTYTIDGADVIVSANATEPGHYTFKLEQLDRLFVNGVYTITRVETNVEGEKFENAFKDWIVRDGSGKITGLHAKIDANADGIQNFALKLINSGYSYIALNGDALMYSAADGASEVSLQALINAILADTSFGSQTLIDLGKNNGGKLVYVKTLEMGNSATDILYSDLDFTLTLTSVPAQMSTVANGLEAIAPYMTFQSAGDSLDINVDIPEKIYEAYLAVMLATGHVDKNDITALNSEIALQFLWDYVEVITDKESAVTIQTFINTLTKLGVESAANTLTNKKEAAEKYFDLVKKAINNDGVEINPSENEKFDISIDAKSKSAINTIINYLGINVENYSTYLGMIKEYKYDTATLSAAANVNLVDAGTAFEAALIDVEQLKAAGIAAKAQGADFTNDLPARLQSVKGQAAVILLNNVEGDLVFNGTTILDLNGYNVDGSITANGKLYIVDSTLSTVDCGTITGAVSGNVVILGGKYNTDVSAFLKTGYELTALKGRAAKYVVTNVLYTIEVDDNGNATYNLNTDFLAEDITSYTTFAKAVAVDIVVDMILNYYTTAALTGADNGLYNVNIDDIIGLIGSTDTVDALINKVLACFDVPGMADFINVILADMLNFNKIARAANPRLGNGILASYTMTTAPWKVAVEHVTNGDYITFGITSNAARTESFNINLKLSGDNVQYIGTLANALAEIVDNEQTYVRVEAQQPTYNGETNRLDVIAGVDAQAVIDLSVNPDYITILAVILANGNPDNKAAIIDTLNNGHLAMLKAEIDKVTVEDVCTALKNLNRNESFAAVAAKVGVTIDTASAAELESIYHLILCGMGKILEVADITGRSSKLGSLDKDNNGTYEWNTTISRNPNAAYNSYSAYLDADASLALVLNLGDLQDAHTAGTDWVYDENGHWHVCEYDKCGVKFDEAEHTMDGAYDENGHWTECECGYKTAEIGHTMDGAYDENGHWTECECGYKTTVIGHTMDGKYDENGHWTECECGHKTAVVGHTMVGKYNATHHWTECACGYKTAEIKHDLYADHDNEDHWEYCACGYETDHEPHTPGEGWAYNDDWHWQHCSVCETIINAAGHIYGDFVKDSETATEYIGHRDCITCDYSIPETQLKPVTPVTPANPTPDTGDESAVMMWTLLLASTVAVGVFLTMTRKKKSENRYF